MKTKIFSGKKIKIRRSSKRDLRNVKKFQNFINSLVEEGAQISCNKKLSLKEEIKWLEEQIRKTKNRKAVFLIAECNNTVVGTTSVTLGSGRESHVGNLGISIRKGYRRMGLGSYLMREIIKLAKKELKPPPKIIRLGVISGNRAAIAIYKKFGFKRVAKIPDQIEFQGKLVGEVIMLLYL